MKIDIFYRKQLLKQFDGADPKSSLKNSAKFLAGLRRRPIDQNTAVWLQCHAAKDRYSLRLLSSAREFWDFSRGLWAPSKTRSCQNMKIDIFYRKQLLKQFDEADPKSSLKNSAKFLAGLRRQPSGIPVFCYRDCRRAQELVLSSKKLPRVEGEEAF